MSNSELDKLTTENSQPKKSKYENYFINSDKFFSDYQLYKQFRMREAEFSSMRNEDAPFQYLSSELSEVLHTVIIYN